MIKHYYECHVKKCEPAKPARPSFRDSCIQKVQAHTWQVSKGGFTMDVHTPGDCTISGLENLATLYNNEDISIPETLQNESIKRRGVNSKRTIYQLQFIIECMEIGEKNKELKMSSSFACRLMKLIGTAEGRSMAHYAFTQPSLKGYPNFCKKDTLDLQQIKGYFGQQIPHHKKALSKMIAKSGDVGNAEVHHTGEEEDDIMY